MAAIAERARAKINLTLRVLGRRADGYHALESLIAFADVGDDVIFNPDAQPAVQMAGRFGAAIAGSNLAEVALQRLAEADASLALGSVFIDKRLPIAAGIGGGSADAAAVLRAARRSNPGSAVDWDGVAISLGADVPVCLADRAALVWGVGEQLAPVPALPRLHVVLACPEGAVAFGKTRSVFGQLAAPPAPALTSPAPLPPFAGSGELLAFMRATGNDLHAAAIRVLPGVAAAETALSALAGCRYVGLSGAGPTSFGVFDGASAATLGAERLRAAQPGWWVEATTLGD